MEAFDASAFGIAPSEALLIDPQQRLMLEDAWEVLAALGAAGALPGGSDMAPGDGSSGADGGTAVVAAQSFWDYAQQTDRALPGVRGRIGLHCPRVLGAWGACQPAAPTNPHQRLRILPCARRWVRPTRPPAAASAWQRAACRSAMASKVGSRMHGQGRYGLVAFVRVTISGSYAHAAALDCPLPQAPPFLSTPRAAAA